MRERERERERLDIDVNQVCERERERERGVLVDILQDGKICREADRHTYT